MQIKMIQYISDLLYHINKNKKRFHLGPKRHTDDF